MLAVVGTSLWIGFGALVVLILVLDLGVFNRKAHTPSLREAGLFTGFCLSLALGFNGFVAWQRGGSTGLEFTTGYLLEQALSVDNLFVFLVLFRSLAVPREFQHRVLFWGILGALVTRGLFIALGAALIARFHFVFYVFGAILLVTGLKLLLGREQEPHPERNPLARLFKRMFPMTSGYRGASFLVKESGRTLATPLFLALVAVEATDVVFALDSIPAVFGITQDPFVVFTSNIFAILGLRSMYFLLAGIMERFHYLKVGLAFVLLFIGAKMVVSDWVHVSTTVSLSTIVVLLGGSVVASLMRPVRSAAGGEESSED
jgi:tellurite resistance protein TerC